jgi:hypothetical protein
MMDQLLRWLHGVLEDVECELGEPEVAELVSMALDRKVREAIQRLEKELGIE